MDIVANYQSNKKALIKLLEVAMALGDSTQIMTYQKKLADLEKEFNAAREIVGKAKGMDFDPIKKEREAILAEVKNQYLQSDKSVYEIWCELEINGNKMNIQAIDIITHIKESIAKPNDPQMIQRASKFEKYETKLMEYYMQINAYNQVKENYMNDNNISKAKEMEEKIESVYKKMHYPRGMVRDIKRFCREEEGIEYDESEYLNSLDNRNRNEIKTGDIFRNETKRTRRDIQIAIHEERIKKLERAVVGASEEMSDNDNSLLTNLKKLRQEKEELSRKRNDSDSDSRKEVLDGIAKQYFESDKSVEEIFKELEKNGNPQEIYPKEILDYIKKLVKDTLGNRPQSSLDYYENYICSASIELETLNIINENAKKAGKKALVKKHEKRIKVVSAEIDNIKSKTNELKKMYREKVGMKAEEDRESSDTNNNVGQILLSDDSISGLKPEEMFVEETPKAVKEQEKRTPNENDVTPTPEVGAFEEATNNNQENPNMQRVQEVADEANSSPKNDKKAISLFGKMSFLLRENGQVTLDSVASETATVKNIATARKLATATVEAQNRSDFDDEGK